METVKLLRGEGFLEALDFREEIGDPFKGGGCPAFLFSGEGLVGADGPSKY